MAKTKSKSGKELIDEIKKQRADYNHWRNKEAIARMRRTSIARKIISAGRAFPKKERELYNEKLVKLLNNVQL
jgi:hypothetical protein